MPLKVGTGNEHPDQAFNRIGFVEDVSNLRTVKGLPQVYFNRPYRKRDWFKDAYLQIKDPWTGRSSLKANFRSDFGNEISYSSSRRESPEFNFISNFISRRA